jgi:RHS repeat-associated protein
VIATTAADGSVKSETLYDAWGNPILKVGSSANKFAYTGHQADAETGLYYFKARYYDPEIGRFISQDPAAGKELQPASYQKYLYAYANPLAFIDPTGRASACFTDRVGGCDTQDSEVQVQKPQQEEDTAALLKRLNAKEKAKPKVKEEPGANWSVSRKPVEITAEKERGPGVEESEEVKDYKQKFGTDSAVARRAKDVNTAISKTGDVIEDVSCVKGMCYLSMGAGIVVKAMPKAEAMALLQAEKHGYRLTEIARAALEALKGGKTEAKAVGAAERDAAKVELNAVRSTDSIAAHEAYKDTLRAAMNKPSVSDPTLAGLVDKLYRPNAKLGSGSTAAAVRHELETGQSVGGAFHSQKATDGIVSLEKWLSNNPTAKMADRAAAENIIRDMRNALKGK